MTDERTRAVRWRLVLGRDAGLDDLQGAAAAMDQALGFLYDREYGDDRNVRDSERGAGLEDSAPMVPEWIDQVHSLFPRRTIERLERDAIERYDITEVVTDPNVLDRVEANETLLKAVLRTKHLMNEDVLRRARNLVAEVVRRLMESLAREIESPFLGVADPRRRSPLKVARNFDARETIRRNLHRFDPETRRLVLEKPYFFSRVRRSMDRWTIIIVVDQSGSMLSSAIHAAVTAAIFWGLRDIDTHLILFDTSVVDLTDRCSDPVETLMQVQLGGGTDIGQALAYAAGKVKDPSRTIVALITDFYEGAPVERLMRTTKALVESGVTLLGLAALDDVARPEFDRQIAGRMVDLGAHVAAMTPGELAAWVAEKVR